MADIAPWYVAMQLCAVAALPLAIRFFGDLPDRGYAFAKVLGVFLVGVALWLGTSYGLLRNEFGGAMLALGAVTAVSYGFGGWRALQAAWDDTASAGRGRQWYVVSVETLFLVAFGVWAWVRAHDPAANHTEQPMDLMFMNSIWTSPTYPPRDAWLAGYPISYYYLGYWLLTTLGHLSSTAAVDCVQRGSGVVVWAAAGDELWTGLQPVCAGVRGRMGHGPRGVAEGGELWGRAGVGRGRSCGAADGGVYWCRGQPAGVAGMDVCARAPIWRDSHRGWT